MKKDPITSRKVLESFIDATYDIISEHGDMSIEIQARDLERLCDLASLGVNKLYEDKSKVESKPISENRDRFYVLKAYSNYSLRDVDVLNAVFQDLLIGYEDNIVNVISTQVVDAGENHNYLLVTVEWKGEPYFNEDNESHGEIGG